MIDFGLLMSVIVALAIPSAVARRWPLRTFGEDASVLDVFIVPATAGLLVGRLVTLALDDPGSIGSLSDMLVIRSGVEFWPAAGAALVVVAWQARREGIDASVRLAEVAPLALIGYAAYEAACLFRDGCFGPLSTFGLRPDGMDEKMFPVGLALAAGIAAAAALVRHLRRIGWPPLAVVAGAVAFVAIARSWTSIWLPHVGEAMTRQHRSSIVVAILAAATCLVVVWGHRRPMTQAVPE